MTGKSGLRERLEAYLESSFRRVQMDLCERDTPWYVVESIPSEPGWYFIETNVPVDVLRDQHKVKSSYDTKAGKSALVKHYDLAARADRYDESLKYLFSTPVVYSGIASSLRSRASEHTEANEGTAALSLLNYDPLASPEYQWWFCYATLNGFWSGPALRRQQQVIVLKLGEQIWRARNGWPILCSG